MNDFESTPGALGKAPAGALGRAPADALGEAPAETRGRAPASWPRRIADEVRSRPFAYGVLAAFLVAGPLASAWLFPEAPPAVSVVGGLALGGYAALCAVPQKFL